MGDVWGILQHLGCWEAGKELSWPWGLWHHVCPAAGVRRSLGCWARLRDGCWMQEGTRRGRQRCPADGAGLRHRERISPSYMAAWDKSPSRGVLRTCLERDPRSLAGSTTQGGEDTAIWKCAPSLSQVLPQHPSPDDTGCTLQGQSPELFSLNETTLSLAWKECLGAFFLFNEEVLQDSYNSA